MGRKLILNETVGLPWVSARAFVRIATNARLHEEPLDLKEAIEVLLEQMRSGQIQGRQIAEAVLAAIAIENGATLASTDAGFPRFPSLSLVNPVG